MTAAAYHRLMAEHLYTQSLVCLALYHVADSWLRWLWLAMSVVFIITYFGERRIARAKAVAK